MAVVKLCKTRETTEAKAGKKEVNPLEGAWEHGRERISLLIPRRPPPVWFICVYVCEVLALKIILQRGLFFSF